MQALVFRDQKSIGCLVGPQITLCEQVLEETSDSSDKARSAGNISVVYVCLTYTKWKVAGAKQCDSPVDLSLELGQDSQKSSYRIQVQLSTNTWHTFLSYHDTNREVWMVRSSRNKLIWIVIPIARQSAHTLDTSFWYVRPFKIGMTLLLLLKVQKVARVQCYQPDQVLNCTYNNSAPPHIRRFLSCEQAQQNVLAQNFKSYFAGLRLENGESDKASWSK